MENKSYQYFDATVMDTLHMIMGNEMVELFTVYAKDSKIRLQDLESLVYSYAPAQDIRMAAHSLKGSSANVGAKPMAELCFQLETLAQEESLDKASVLLTDIKNLYSLMQVELNDIITRH
ncbi:Hpt domain-containing protein [Halioxenophilus aromaticivorans]|uniref:HPt domain-containing protein n=1 Tax=Halioxenophilus aromaticivorans TaxID=1306992 RepID=A0AAV3TZH2_9ALTE